MARRGKNLAGQVATIKLVTLAEYKNLKPKLQGYVAYMQGQQPGSELKGHDECPYPAGSPEKAEWDLGQRIGCQDAQDTEEG